MSPLGVFLDLTADKVLVAGALIAMVEVSLLSAWIAALLLIRELVVQGVRQLAASADVVMPARALGQGQDLRHAAGMGLLMLAYDADTPAVRWRAPDRATGSTTVGVADHAGGHRAEPGLRAGLHPGGAAAAAGAGAGRAYLISLRSIWRMAMNRQIPKKTTR